MLRLSSGISQRKSPAFLAGKPGLINQKNRSMQQMESLREKRGSGVLLHKPQNDPGQRVILVPLPKVTSLFDVAPFIGSQEA